MKWNTSGQALLLSMLSLLLGVTQTQAETEIDSATVSPWSFSGYGTLGYSHENEDDINFVRDVGQKALSPREGTWLTDSSIGLQAAYRFSLQTDAVVQVVARDKDGATLGNSIEWAYLSHRPSENLNLRFGRVGVDVFLMSDYRNLGYAQITVRPKNEFYGFLPFYSLDGLDAAYTLNTDAGRWVFKSQFGRVQASIPLVTGDSYDFVANNVFDFTVTHESGPWRFKAVYSTLKLVNEAPLAALTEPLAGIAALGVPGVSSEAAGLLDGMTFKGGVFDYLALGASYDDGTWLAQGEVSKISADRQIFPQGTAAYLNIGRRFGLFTPYASLSGFRASNSAVAAQSDWASVLGAQAGLLQGAAITASNMFRADQDTFSLGVRWDFHPQAALKLQWDRVYIHEDGYGLWSSMPGATLAGDDRVNLVTTTLDWMF
jgi:hypothetical protein